jgi:regulator of sigma E protease
MIALMQTILSFLVALLILVSIHEFGHFYVARRCGVKVLRFSIGLGQVIWSTKDKQGTEYALSAFPLGGYVKMLDEREAPVAPEEQHLAFNNKNVWQRIAIVSAGPAANFLLAILLFWGLLLQGEKGLIPIIGHVEPNSIAAQAGLEKGQEFIAIDGEPTPTWAALNKALARRLGETGTIRFSVAYPDSSQTANRFLYESEAQLQDWMKDTVDPDPVAGLGIELYLPEMPVIIEEVAPNTPAAKVGITAGDRIVKVDEIENPNWRDWANYVAKNPGRKMKMSIERGTESLEIEITPEPVEKEGRVIGRVGIAGKPQVVPDELYRSYEYSVPRAFVAAVSQTWEISGFVLLSVKKLILGEISTKNLSGPISIAKVAGSSAEGGLKSFIGFLALISIFLAVFNLLPIPVLDGGHLFYYFIEVIRGKPVSDRVQIMGYQLGLFLIISLSALALYNDIMRL